MDGAHWSTELSRRDFLRTGTLALGALGLAGMSIDLAACGVSSASSTNSSGPATLTVMTVGGSWGDSIKTLIAEPYASKHNGLTLAWDNRPNAQQIAAIQAMRGKPTVDTVEVGGPQLGNSVNLGLLDRIDVSKVPNYAHVADAFKDPYWAARSIAPFVLAFNTTKVSKAEAESAGWKVLTNPELKGRVAIPAFDWQGEMWLNAINLALGGTYTNMNPAMSLAQSVIHSNSGVIMQSNDDGLSKFTTGEIWAAPFWTGRTYQLQDKGIPLDFVYPTGWSAYTFGFAVVKGTQHKDLVDGFIDYSLSPDVQLQIAKQFSYVPTLADMTIPADLPRLKIASEDWAKAAKIDWIQAAKQSDANLQAWNMQVIGS